MIVTIIVTFRKGTFHGYTTTHSVIGISWKGAFSEKVGVSQLHEPMWCAFWENIISFFYNLRSVARYKDIRKKYVPYMRTFCRRQVMYNHCVYKTYTRFSSLRLKIKDNVQ